MQTTTAATHHTAKGRSILASWSIYLTLVMAMVIVTTMSRAWGSESRPLAASTPIARTPLDTQRKRESISLDYLMEACAAVGQTAGGQIPYFDCESYIYGILDAEVAIFASHSEDHEACHLSSLAPWQVYRDIDREVPRSLWPKPAAPLIIQLLRRKYPCGSAASD